APVAAGGSGHRNPVLRVREGRLRHPLRRERQHPTPHERRPARPGPEAGPGRRPASVPRVRQRIQRRLDRDADGDRGNVVCAVRPARRLELPVSERLGYRYLGRSGLRVSEIGLGTQTFGRETDEAGAHAILERYVEAGGNLIDTADIYNQGKSERWIGTWLQ